MPVDPATRTESGAHRPRTHPLRRRGSAREERTADARAPRAGGLHGLRGSAELARPGVHRRRPHRRDPDPAQGDDQARGARQGERAAPAGRHFRPGPAARQLSPRAERRDAAAGHDRHRAVLRSRPADRGQSDHGAGRHDPDPDTRPREAAPRSARDGRAVDHARSRRRRQALRPGRDHVRRRSDGARRRLHPRHPYTRRLIDALPKLGRPEQRLLPIDGRPPDPANLPAGCPFAPRCYKAKPDCRDTSVPLVDTEGGHGVRCLYPEE